MLSDHPSIAESQTRFNLDFGFPEKVLACLQSQGFSLEELKINFGEIVFDSKTGKLIPKSHDLFNLLMILRGKNPPGTEISLRPVMALLNEKCRPQLLIEDQSRIDKGLSHPHIPWNFGTVYSCLDSVYYPADRSNHDWRQNIGRVQLQLLS